MKRYEWTTRPASRLRAKNRRAGSWPIVRQGKLLSSAERIARNRVSMIPTAGQNQDAAKGRFGMKRRRAAHRKEGDNAGHSRHPGRGDW